MVERLEHKLNRSRCVLLALMEELILPHKENAMKTRHLTVEQPDTAAIIDFLGDHAVTVKATLEKTRYGNYEIHVAVIADDYENTILGEILAPVPPSDKRK